MVEVVLILEPGEALFKLARLELNIALPMLLAGVWTGLAGVAEAGHARKLQRRLRIIQGRETIGQSVRVCGLGRSSHLGDSNLFSFQVLPDSQTPLHYTLNLQASGAAGYMEKKKR